MASNNQRLGPAFARLPGDAPREFMENRITLPEGIVYSQEVDRFLLEPELNQQTSQLQALWETTHQDRERLFKALENLQDRLWKRDPSVARADLRSYTWPEVMKDIDRAVLHYKGKRLEGASGKVYASFRKLGENANTFGGWLKLLPDGDYGSPICGAFHLLLGAAGRMHKARNDIYEALQDIPDAVSKAQRYLEVYNDVKALNLSLKTVELFKAVLQALEAIVIFLTESGFRRASKALFAGDDFIASISDRIERVRKISLQINEEATICAQIRARKTDESIDFIKDKIQSFRQNDSEMHRRTTKQIVEQTVTELLHCFLLGNETINPHTRRPYPLLTAKRTPPKRRETRNIRERMENLSEESSPKSAPLTVAKLLLEISFDHDMVTLDRERCRLDGQAMSLSDKDRASHVARSQPLQDWLLQTQKPSALLTLANMRHNTSLFSPLSFLAAEFAHIYADTGSTVTISFFCGLHAQVLNRRANAIGMMISLLGQLLSYECFESQFDLGFVEEDLIERLVQEDVYALCEVFKTLILQIETPMVLFAFIDTISIYETRQRLDETKIVLDTLKELVQETRSQQSRADEAGSERGEEGSGVVFKLLVTDPGHSCKVESMFEDDEVFLVDEHVDGAKQGVIDMSDLDWKLSGTEEL